MKIARIVIALLLLAVLPSSVFATRNNYFHSVPVSGVSVSTQVVVGTGELVDVIVNNGSSSSATGLQIQDRSTGCTGILPDSDPSVIARVTSSVPIVLTYKLQFINGLCVVALSGSATVTWK